VNSTIITKDEFEMIWKMPMYRKATSKEELAGLIMEQELLAQEAISRRYDKRKEFIVKFEQVKREMLAQELLLYGILEKVRNSDEPKKYYEKHKDEFVDQKIEVSHILIRDKKEADETFQSIKDNRLTFEQAAKEKSIDEKSFDKGGKLGPIEKGLMVKEFDETAFKLKEGEISEPVQSAYGYHIIRCDKILPVGIKDFSSVRMQIENKLYFDEVKELTGKLKEKSGIVINKEKLETK